jgi:hypothetical protein
LRQQRFGRHHAFSTQQVTLAAGSPVSRSGVLGTPSMLEPRFFFLSAAAASPTLLPVMVLPSRRYLRSSSVMSLRGGELVASICA